MNQQQVEQWIAENGGAGAVQFSEQVKEIDNPAGQYYGPDGQKNPNWDSKAPEKVKITVYSWVNPKTKAVLSVRPQANGAYELVERESAVPSDSDDARTRARQDAADARAERGEDRADAAADRANAAADRADRNEDRSIAAQEAANTRADRTEARAERTEDRTAVKDANAEARTSWSDQLAALEARRKQVIDGINAQIEQGKLDAQAAKDAYDRFYKEEVELPFKAAQEERARAADERLVQMEQRRRLEAGAADDVVRSKFGYDAGRDAVKDAKDMLPYMVGPNFNRNMAEAVNNLSRGKGGTNFSPEDFLFQIPDFEAIAEKGAANALKGLSPYADRLAAQGGAMGIDPNEQLSRPNMEGLPARPDLSGAPPIPAPIQRPRPPTYDVPMPPKPLTYDEVIRRNLPPPSLTPAPGYVPPTTPYQTYGGSY
jgi:hypothetical protein